VGPIVQHPSAEFILKRDKKENEKKCKFLFMVPSVNESIGEKWKEVIERITFPHSFPSDLEGSEEKGIKYYFSFTSL